MTIQIKQEQEQLIGLAIEAGLIDTAEEAVELGVQTIRQRLAGRRSLRGATAENIVELFANSPFAGLAIDFERGEDFGRAIEL